MPPNDRHCLGAENHIHMEMVLSFSFVRQAAGNTASQQPGHCFRVEWQTGGTAPVEMEMNPDGNTEHCYPSR